jgi:hemerythrin
MAEILIDNQVASLVTRIRRLLKGSDLVVQGAVLADLLANWLTAHTVNFDAQETTALRERMLTMHLNEVRQLMPERLIGTSL